MYPPPSTMSGVPHSSHVWSYVQDHPQLVGSPRSPPSLPGGYPKPPSPIVQPLRSLRMNPFFAPQLHAREFHHQGRMKMRRATTLDTLPESNDLDEELLSSYHEHSSIYIGYRTASLSLSSAAGMSVSYMYAGPTTPTATTTSYRVAIRSGTLNTLCDHARRGYRCYTYSCIVVDTSTKCPLCITN